MTSLFILKIELQENGTMNIWTGTSYRRPVLGKNLKQQGSTPLLKINIINTKLFDMHKIFFLLSITIAILMGSCTNAGEQNKKEIKSEKHDSAQQERKEADTLGMKMGGNELESKKK